MLVPFRLCFTVLTLALLLAGLGGCNSVPASKRIVEAVAPYRFDRVQGNVITREQVDALKTGMPRAVVKDILGTPLLVSVFHADRWDYMFTLLRQGAEPQVRRVTVFFNGDALERYEAEDLPTEAEFVASLKSKGASDKLPPMEASPQSLEQFPPASKPAPAAAPPARPAADYPPLEPASR